MKLDHILWGSADLDEGVRMFAALTGVDVCPMEGFSSDGFNEILGLGTRGLSAVVLAAVGHRAPDDAAASLPKVRFPEAEMIDHR